MINQKTINAYKRVNITLPNKTIKLLDSVADKGERSSFVDRAVHFYIEEVGRANLNKQLREGAMERSSRDLSLADDWFLIEEQS
jgi:CopG family transcriptional regulator/antitoxin EndoAI